jgi:hypothetical protein
MTMDIKTLLLIGRHYAKKKLTEEEIVVFNYNFMKDIKKNKKF